VERKLLKLLNRKKRQQKVNRQLRLKKLLKKNIKSLKLLVSWVD